MIFKLFCWNNAPSPLMLRGGLYPVRRTYIGRDDDDVDDDFHNTN